MAQSVVIETAHPTYSYRADNITPVANATDVLLLVGAKGKCIRVTKIAISGSATAAALLDMTITKRTFINIGGTFTIPTATKYDPFDPAPSGVLHLYTANPTSLGNGTGLEGDKIYLHAQTTPAGEPTHWSVDYTGIEAKCPILRSANDCVSIGFAGQTIPDGTSLFMYIEWTEEAGV